VPWLRSGSPFPPLDAALDDPNGLLAAGGDLSPARLLAAYRHGIFPWYNEAQPILWWSPDPRTVLFVAEFRLSRSLRRVVRQRRFEIRVDTAFRSVMAGWAEPRSGEGGDWIPAGVVGALPVLHRRGRRRFEIRVDTAFRSVMAGCAEPRSGQSGTWITPAVIDAYTVLHREGRAHSIEAWRNGKLAGGLYGVTLGRMFYGESMFARQT